MLNFKHSGDIGDIIYSLPTIKYLNGGNLFLNTNNSLKNISKTKFNQVAFEVIKPILERQQYIKSVNLFDKQPIDINLDIFRYHDLTTGNIAATHCKTFGIDENVLIDSWLECDSKPSCDILINYTERYRNDNFKWSEVFDMHYGSSIGFIGLKNEYESFLKLTDKSYREIQFVETKDLLEVAEYLSGCEMFYGNQSSPFAIAEGLKINRVCIVHQHCPNCIFPYNNNNFYIC